MIGVVVVGAASAAVGLVAGGAADPSSLAQYGIAGTVAAILMVVTGYLYRQQQSNWGRERDELLARAVRLEDELRALNHMVQTQTMTALNEATRAVTDAIGKMRNAR